MCDSWNVSSMELFLDKSSLVVNKRFALDVERAEYQPVVCGHVQNTRELYQYLACFRCGKTTVSELYVVCTSCMQQCPEYKESTWLVSDVERPQCVSCMQP